MGSRLLYAIGCIKPANVCSLPTNSLMYPLGGILQNIVTSSISMMRGLQQAKKIHKYYCCYYLLSYISKLLISFFKGHKKSGAFTFFTLKPYTAAVCFHNLFTYIQAQAIGWFAGSAFSFGRGERVK